MLRSGSSKHAATGGTNTDSWASTAQVAVVWVLRKRHLILARAVIGEEVITSGCCRYSICWSTQWIWRDTRLISRANPTFTVLILPLYFISLHKSLRYYSKTGNEKLTYSFKKLNIAYSATGGSVHCHRASRLQSCDVNTAKPSRQRVKHGKQVEVFFNIRHYHVFIFLKVVFIPINFKISSEKHLHLDLMGFMQWIQKKKKKLKHHPTADVVEML